MHILHGTQLLLVSKCSVGCPLTVLQLLVSMQVPSENGPRFDATHSGLCIIHMAVSVFSLGGRW